MNKNSEENKPLRISMQYFGEKADGNGADNAGNGDDGQKDGTQSDKGKTFTQEELDAAIEKRLARERKKTEKPDSDGEKNKSPEDKTKEKAQSDRVSALEAKLLCFEKDVAKESVPDVIALAKAYQNDDTGFEEAIDKVLKKYPSFVKGTKSDEEEKEEKPGTTGKKTKGGKSDIDGVEAAFYKRNPDLKTK